MKDFPMLLGFTVMCATCAAAFTAILVVRQAVQQKCVDAIGRLCSSRYFTPLLGG